MEAGAGQPKCFCHLFCALSQYPSFEIEATSYRGEIHHLEGRQIRERFSVCLYFPQPYSFGIEPYLQIPRRGVIGLKCLLSKLDFHLYICNWRETLPWYKQEVHSQETASNNPFACSPNHRQRGLRRTAP